MAYLIESDEHNLGDVAVVDAVVSVAYLLLSLATATSDQRATAGLGAGGLGALRAAAARLGQGSLGAGRPATPATHVRAGATLQGRLLTSRRQDPSQGHETLEDVADVVVIFRGALHQLDSAEQERVVSSDSLTLSITSYAEP